MLVGWLLSRKRSRSASFCFLFFLCRTQTCTCFNTYIRIRIMLSPGSGAGRATRAGGHVPVYVLLKVLSKVLSRARVCVCVLPWLCVCAGVWACPQRTQHAHTCCCYITALGPPATQLGNNHGRCCLVGRQMTCPATERERESEEQRGGGCGGLTLQIMEFRRFAVV
jgi:hypothetical protein